MSLNTVLKVASALGNRSKVEDAFNPAMDSHGAMLLSKGVRERVRR